MQWPSWSSRTQPFALEPAWDIEERAHHRRGLRMMDESDGDFARGIELPNLDASRLFGVDVPHARGSDTGANAAEESRRIAAFDHAVQDCAGAFRSEEHTSELQALMRTSSAVFCLQKK